MLQAQQHKALLSMLHHPSGNNKGFSIIELLVGFSILTMSLGALLGFLAFTLTTSSFLKQQTEATAFAQELLEAVRSFRDGTSWNVDDPQNQYDGLGKAQTGAAYHIAISQDIPPRWQIILGEETLSIFSRSVTFENVQRDVNSNIVVTGGVNDPNTKKATATVSWSAKSKNHQIDIVTYFTNWKQ